MALSLSQTAALRRLLKPGMRVAAMGYPDTIAPMPMIEALLGDKIADLEYRDDSLQICARHGLQNRKIPDAESVFALLGCKLDVFDIVQERGCEILCDLNVPFGYSAPINISKYPRQSYDIVLDVGTVEHCFNIAQAMMNMADLVKLGGYIIHENPYNCGNHGFYNLNPTFYADFYEANGFKLLTCFLAGRDGSAMGAPHTKRFRFTAEEKNTFALAQRVNIQPFVMPVQSKYANVIPAAGVDRAKEIASG
jgi:hypothetical protein